MAGDQKQAEKYYRKALQLNPYLPNALLRMAELTHDNNNYLSSRAYVQRYLEIAKPSPRLLWVAVRTERALNDKLKAGEYARMLKGRFPDSDETGHLLELENDERKQR